MGPVVSSLTAITWPQVFEKKSLLEIFVYNRSFNIICGDIACTYLLHLPGN